MAWVQKRHQVTAPQCGRIDHLVQELTGLSRAQVRGLFDHGCVRVGGALVHETFRPVKAGDVVELRYDRHQRYREKPRPWHDPHFRIVFEDDALIVVDKAAAALTVPTGEGEEANTLVEALSRYLGRGGQPREAHVVHRLDRGTSGLLVFAKNPEAAQALKDLFAQRKPQRYYLALVAGHVQADQGRFESYLATAPNLDRYSTRNPKHGELAITHYRVLQRLRGATLMRCQLETGRRNQIRVQFAEAGHPVLGDQRYRPELAQHPGWTARRLALHAASLALAHPVTGQELQFESPMPQEMRAFVNRHGGR